jgi:hypothetical protein
MTTRVFAAIAALVLVSVSPAHARHHRYSTVSSPSDPRPHAWCGWWLRHELGVADRSYNLARNWTRFGSRASSAAVGVVVVWYHHVGIITGRTQTGWIIKSGNDGHAVRERERSLRGVIAYRWPSRMALN